MMMIDIIINMMCQQLNGRDLMCSHWFMLIDQKRDTLRHLGRVQTPDHIRSRNSFELFRHTDQSATSEVFLEASAATIQQRANRLFFPFFILIPKHHSI